ncbi:MULTISPECIES: arsenosugar biosynthesis radical SAM (seleno)protein ArsS [unclassified Mucilaginibacter]|uniref:arsenosugar biosynthesis radical SAM (seleno)protein ArsS n=1 Tax=unclassified Mucilaginibacter TaxID=2617802 RepID=UPI002AC986B1|nr:MULTISPECIES: arsenosugar biosynthesis radical SAM (seleno)protein ArsS [unclassified Mucilaginibacter]MEB0260284.1 arsenosugar biosynthesis radical SAM protein ArsS [Mucilaginibacter sp. 10I4]MEB0277305.1 arsenosugar biosynthesis radical SAM protein ArsS [Mucilaginibacter sp. 10B2]MEB0302156.1 arsenosugar biosynthesis radical SAM protein ArsS [Mucilaginibacter sp. 5C4]WPX25431.1 arsenosugar biosynthesis radical SAM protein ArsS [Mucilaginibacter sp. 5C4]
MIKSLHVLQHHLADSNNQLSILEDEGLHKHASFTEKLSGLGEFPLRATGVEIFQVNVGKMCNQVCKHCHVDAGPDRKEIMTRETMQLCLDVLAASDIKTVDLTGGAPEMNPDFRWFVTEIKKLNRHIIVRCNLTIILANKKFHDLPEFFRDHQVEVVSSLPSFTKDRTDRQRGDGVFEDSIRALQLLNEAGYGVPDGGLLLNLVYNPAGAFLPPLQQALEREYKDELLKNFGIRFNNLFAITNMPISRYLDYLLSTGNYDKYMEKLISAFNPSAVQNVMCRNTISVGWNGYLYDCDFNQMLDLPVSTTNSSHLSSYDGTVLDKRYIVLNQHCYGCTAGAGSSCSGAVAD